MRLVVYDLGMIQTGMNHPLVRIWVWIKMTQDFHYNLVDYTDLAIIKDMDNIQTETVEDFGAYIRCILEGPTENISPDNITNAIKNKRDLKL